MLETTLGTTGSVTSEEECAEEFVVWQGGEPASGCSVRWSEFSSKADIGNKN